RSGVAVS
ncbi:hypothetical protein D039_3832B, partial [Vibrio parahaemolyticus EKP-028]